MMCWLALDRATQLADAGFIPARRAAPWRAEAASIRQFIERNCWSERLRSYVRFPGSEELDASLLLAIVVGYGDAREHRLASTFAAIRRELGSAGRGHRVP